MLLIFCLTPTLIAQGSTASKHCEYRNPHGVMIEASVANQAWSMARRLGAPAYPKWQRPALIIWHPHWNGQTLGRTWSEVQVDKKGRATLCEYVTIFVPQRKDTNLFVEVLAHEYLHLIYVRRRHLEPEFKLEHSLELGEPEAWVRKLLGQEDGPRCLQ